MEQILTNTHKTVDSISMCAAETVKKKHGCSIVSLATTCITFARTETSADDGADDILHWAHPRAVY